MSTKKGRHRKQLPTSNKRAPAQLSDPVTGLSLQQGQVVITHHDFDACLFGLHDQLKGDREKAERLVLSLTAQAKRDPAGTFQPDNIIMFLVAFCYAQLGNSPDKAWEMLKSMPEVTTVEYED